ncbi:hypothetical protein F4703DRAFT_1874904, partial [Phycomyces blakesleeanus]
MTPILLYEDGHGNVVDESGGPEPVSSIVDQNKFIISYPTGHDISILPARKLRLFFFFFFFT